MGTPESVEPYDRGVARETAKKTAAQKRSKKPGSRPAASDATGSKSARTRERILDAAAHVLSRKGYAGTRLADVAEQAEVQAPAIYYYYSSREDLIEAVMHAGIAHMREHVEKVLDELPPSTDPLDRILAAVEAHLRFELEISDYTSAAIRNQGQVPAELRIRYDEESDKYGAMWRGLMDEARKKKRLRKSLDPRLAQGLVLGAINWTPEWWDPQRGSIDVLVANAQDLVRHGLSA
jgi:TetR/AcrR family transcriptional regulator, cholesterol catabolism regulator